MKKIVACLGVCIALFGCKAGSKLSRVDASMILPASAARMRLEERQIFLMPSEIESPVPAFPSGYSGKDMDATVCAEFVVSAEGEVSDIRQISDEEGCEPDTSIQGRTLFSEVRGALSRWSYFAGAICTFEIDEGECERQGAKMTPSAVRLAYRFRFFVLNGKKSVQTRKSSKPGSSETK